MKLTVYDKGGVLDESNAPRMVRRVIEACEGLKDGVGLTTREMAGRLGVTQNAVQQHSGDSRFAPYKIGNYLLGHKRVGNVFANKTTVKEYHDGESD